MRSGTEPHHHEGGRDKDRTNTGRTNGRKEATGEYRAQLSRIQLMKQGKQN